MRLSCPYCPKWKKQYRELLEHALVVGQSSSQKRSVRERATHLALMIYLKNDFLYMNAPSKSVNEVNPQVNKVNQSSSQEKSVREDATHLALSKYLEKDLINMSGPSSKPVNEGTKIVSPGQTIIGRSNGHLGLCPDSGLKASHVFNQVCNRRCFK
ncbi:hypothetical protein VNO78_21415 [Psophocarpus tetragonolobus]|uniref:Zinc finger-XS domain-containing protein n=1 Tax=Psophocarpus tetragonolobus TaxID=3891 RepID=A0AAN9XI25_PSOTE